MDNDFATGYALGADSNNNCNNGGMFGGDCGWWAIILFAMIFGWGNGGWGGGFGNGANGIQGALTRADLCQDMNFSQVENGIRGIQQGICDSTYALNNSIMSGFNSTNINMLNGFHGVDNAVCTLGYQTQAGFNALSNQMASCCCETQRAIDGVNYNLATQSCETRQAINSATRDLLENNNSNTRAILDFLTQDKISALQNENQTLRLAASQSNQNAVLMAAMDANKAEIIRRTGNDCPIPAYVVPNPNCCYGNNYYGFPNGYNYNNCGCGNTCGCC